VARLKGVRVAVVAGPEFEDLELFYPYYRFVEEGAEGKVIGPEKKAYAGKHGLTVNVDATFDEVRPELDVEVEELGLRIFLARDPALWRGVGMAVRKRRERTWTQPLFLQRRPLPPLASAWPSPPSSRLASLPGSG